MFTRKAREQAKPKQGGTTAPQPHVRRHLLKPRLDQIKATCTSIRCRVHPDDGTLRTLGSDRFGLWRERGNRLDRYICFDAESMRWGWARVGRQRISRIHTGLSSEGRTHVDYDGIRMWFSVSARDVTSPEQPNMEINFRLSTAPLCTMTGMLLLDDLIVDTVESVNEVFKGLTDYERFRVAINNNSQDLKTRILNFVSHPFSFKQAMVGDKPRAFFGEGDFRVGIDHLRGTPILVVYR